MRMQVMTHEHVCMQEVNHHLHVHVHEVNMNLELHCTEYVMHWTRLYIIELGALQELQQAMP